MNALRRHPPTASDRRASTRGAGGFTLVELLVSIAMIAVLSVAMGSAVLIASRAIDDGQGSASRAIAAADVVECIKAELRLATSFTERTSNAVTFTVPDRDGDGAEERIRYAWSGEPRTPLTRVYNDAPPEILASEVRSFDLSYFLQTIQPPPGVGSGQESGELLLAGHLDGPGGSLRTFTVNWEDWCAQYFRPALPSDATAWTITRVQIMARRDRNPYDGVISVAITAADGERTPAYPVLEDVRLNESSLSSQMSWVDVPFGNVKDLDPSRGMCVVIAFRSGTGGVADVQYEDGGQSMTTNAHWMTTRNRGYSFTTPNDRQDMLFRVHGTYRTARSGP